MIDQFLKVTRRTLKNTMDGPSTGKSERKSEKMPFKVKFCLSHSNFNGGTKSKQKKKHSLIKAEQSLAKALNFDGSFSEPSTCSTPSNKRSKVSPKSAPPAKKQKTRRGPSIVVEDDTLITIDQTGEVLDLTASDKPEKVLNGKARKIPDYTLSEGEISKESDEDEDQIVEEKIGAFTRSTTGFQRCTKTAQDKGNIEKKQFPAMGLRAE